MFMQAFFDDLAEFVVVVKGPYFGYFAQLFECGIIQLINVADMLILDGGVW